MPIKIKFCGAVRTVTGSMHLIKTDKSTVMIDCGLFQGHRDEYYRINSTFSFEVDKVDALVVSHAHIDHLGNIPNLVKQGFNKSIYTTRATADLAKIMLLDSAHIQEENIKFVNKINRKKGLPTRQPLYTTNDAEKSLEYIQGRDYSKEFKITDDISCTFYDAGHILGSSIPVFKIKDGERQINLAYAVDLGRKEMPLLKDPVVMPPGMLDYLIIESTYGAREHENMRDAENMLADFVNKAVERGGKVIIPSFALGRAQRVLYYLSELMKARRIPELPIYVDSPMAVNVTDVFKKHIECYDDEAKLLVYHEESPFYFKNLHFVESVEASKALNRDDKSMIIISASGMCEAGRILHHLKNNIEDEKNMIIVVGYMAENTLGRRIVERHDVVRIFGQEYRLMAQVGVINAFSAHADKHGLLKYAQSSNHNLKNIFVVHGEEEQSKAFIKTLKANKLKAHLPVIDEEIVV